MASDNVVSITARYKSNTTTLSIPRVVHDMLDIKLEKEDSEFTAQMWLASKGSEALKNNCSSPSAFVRESALMEILPEEYLSGYEISLDCTPVVLKADLNGKLASVRVDMFASLYHAVMSKFGTKDNLIGVISPIVSRLMRDPKGHKDFAKRLRSELVTEVVTG